MMCSVYFTVLLLIVSQRVRCSIFKLINNQSIASVPGNIPHTTVVINLENNKITTVNNGDLGHLANLQTLRLSKNIISVFENNSLEGLHLKYFNVSDNELRDIPYLADSKNSLLELNLYNNNITIVKRGAFSNMSTLTNLDLGRNEIRDIENGAFANMPALSTLNISNNKLNYISNGTFHNLNGLVRLVLYANQISQIETGAMDIMPNLIVLSLSNNRFTRVTIGNLSKISYLYILHNKLTQMPELGYELPELRTLHLLGNYITSINPEYFISTPTLKTLRLDNNFLTDFDGFYLKSIEELNLRGNHLASFPNITLCITTLSKLNVDDIYDYMNNMDLSTIFGSGDLRTWQNLKSFNLDRTHKFESFQSILNTWLSSTPNLEDLSFSATYMKTLLQISHLNK